MVLHGSYEIFPFVIVGFGTVMNTFFLNFL